MPKLPAFSASKRGDIRGWTRSAADLADERDVRKVVSRLRYGHLDPMGKETQVAKSGTVRLDRQSNPSAGGANLQVQLNDPKKLGLAPGAGTTVAQVVVRREVFQAADAHGDNVRAALEKQARSALIKSLGSGGGAFEVVLR